ncbi:hydrogenase assembly chaperone hypC/hupF [Flexistipes sinusarabici DSM 4947]|uniref:Hydrogenase assembly chaperone hypC/hupF n=2 Tax=Flexistipes sinusarabici TaxID=2352 RepID=F8E9E0_FLESM|nr:HypC/HybG/HupF family hydrogenase formation chaperone [Flexistipes sinusarabici]AEI14192.1 hydrogenase assembly chaperone hypC/hupF [Flexistipes sinusarabici DSM 4947]TYB34372.1 MAG: HypC/HybG/HupF family hydrogenase formation chaperone [Flexistipes sinusarabici]HCW92885.1 HypC/HybG/HupF family hydrogenase formation chaperone [Flexistipes sinusarabici]
MCLGLPGKIIEKDEFSAVVDIGGTKREVSLMMLPEEVRIGDYVMVHVGFAISKMDPEEARKTLETIMEIADEIDY